MVKPPGSWFFLVLMELGIYLLLNLKPATRSYRFATFFPGFSTSFPHFSMFCYIFSTFPPNFPISFPTCSSIFPHFFGTFRQFSPFFPIFPGFSPFFPSVPLVLPRRQLGPSEVRSAGLHHFGPAPGHRGGAPRVDQRSAPPGDVRHHRCGCGWMEGWGYGWLVWWNIYLDVSNLIDR